MQNISCINSAVGSEVLPGVHECTCIQRSTALQIIVGSIDRLQPFAFQISAFIAPFDEIASENLFVHAANVYFQ